MKRLAILFAALMLVGVSVIVLRAQNSNQNNFGGGGGTINTASGPGLAYYPGAGTTISADPNITTDGAGHLITAAGAAAGPFGVQFGPTSTVGLYASGTAQISLGTGVSSAGVTLLSGTVELPNTGGFKFSGTSASNGGAASGLCANGTGVVEIATGSTCNAQGALQARHLTQDAANGYAGSCTMAAGTSCTATLTAAYTTPVCTVAVQGTTVIAGACSVSGTTVTVTAASSNSATWAFHVFGNPN